MNGSDRGLNLIRPRRAMPQRLFDEHQRLVDQLAIPQAAILIFEQHDFVVAIESRRRACVLEQQQRQ